MKKIIVFDTSLCTSNLGDNIIYDAIEDNMQHIFDSGTAMRLGTHVTNFTFFQLIKGNFKSDFAKNADLKFVCGTNLLSQKMLFKLNAQWQLKSYNTSLYKNCVLVGVGATGQGTSMDPYAKYLYKKVLSKKYIHCVRDEQSKEMVESLGFKVFNTGCPTLWKLTPEHCMSIPTKKSDDCIFSVSGHQIQQDPVNDQLMINLLRRKYNRCWAWLQTTEDEKYLDSLTNTKGIEKIYSLNQYHNILMNTAVDYIGTRLHGGVYALQHAKRTIVICIDHRAMGFHDTNNLPIIMRNSIEKDLEKTIDSEFDTRIKINQSAINEFLSQF